MRRGTVARESAHAMGQGDRSDAALPGDAAVKRFPEVTAADHDSGSLHVRPQRRHRRSYPGCMQPTHSTQGGVVSIDSGRAGSPIIR
jgi:hypothetical protein